MEMEDIIFTVFFILVIIAVISLTIWFHVKARSIAFEWAKRNGYLIKSLRFRWLIKGPFMWRTSKGQVVFYAKIQTEEGKIENAFIRCGDYWKGMLKSKIEVKWEKHLQGEKFI